MKRSEELRRLLESIHRKSYPAYKSAQGAYDFGDFILSIDHVQGDPFASPSKVSIIVSHEKAQYPASYFDCPWKKTALEDYLIRQFGRELSQFNFKAKGSGKSGLMAISSPGPEILSRTACDCTKTGIHVRFEVGFPANGRTINSDELIRILFDFLPRCIRSVFFYKNRNPKEVLSVIHLSEDQQAIRLELKQRKLVSFVADGSVLARESGVSSRPMKNGVPFVSPESLKVTFDLPHKGTLSGMGIPEGITLIVGGGYHGKSTLLKALELGVYNHIAGDGREYVITDDTAVKLRAEDGRSINNVDISLFINDLPNKKDTHSFSTADASGSTSQAAAVIESWEAGSSTFLIDEDTSATNFMLRDELMQQIIRRDKEPITPFIERARDLFGKAGISTVMVAGSSGAYFYIADTIIQMDCYRPFDITAPAKQACAQFGPDPTANAPDFHLPAKGRKLSVSSSSPRQRGNSFLSKEPEASFQKRGGFGREERIKTKVHGKDSLQVGREQVELRFVEQLIHSEQTAALAQMVRYCVEKQLFARYSVKEIADILISQIQRGGLPSISDSSYAAMGLCMPRKQEIFACLNRYRG
ncbi:MAG: ABC-ATPase domain-containing protein [Lachnospiraceae bacterium]|jgi:predicted ABC-class ATPase|nr:ABC-ATPase domain-containing protein [Lachnospiraceae bacterium]